jgi:hypothetical protein
MCKTNLICRNGRLDLSSAEEALGIPVTIRFSIESMDDGEYDFTEVNMTDEFNMESIELFGEVKEKAISILLGRDDLWEEICINLDYNKT